ncbi:MAG: FAD-binding protein, partial [Chloroflexi bacterium]|nr:FAD-binding protein [Chloroflexota bacterium]
VRPHWAKLFAMSPAQVHPQYERLADFRALMRHYDPQGKFCNEFLARYIGEA